MTQKVRRRTHLDFAHGAIAYPVDVARRSVDQGGSVLRRTRPATRMPNRCALQIHFFAVAKRIAALGTASARRVKVMIVTGLQHFSTNVTLAVSTFDAEGLLVVLLTVWLAVLSHVFAAQHCSTHQTPKITNLVIFHIKEARLALTGSTKCATDDLRQSALDLPSARRHILHSYSDRYLLGSLAFEGFHLAVVVR